MLFRSEKSSFWRGSKWIKNKHKEIEALAERFGLKFPVDRPIWQLSIGEQQRVEIVKTLYRGADIIILDEPTSVLTPGEAEQLFETLQVMKQEGKTVIMTTHKMREVLASSDRISVMRKGKMIATLATADTDELELARLMVGREVTITRQERKETAGETLLEVKNLDVVADHGRKVLRSLSMSVSKGEIVGVAGVAGNGQKELAEVLTGLRSWVSGEIHYDGKVVKTASVRGAIDAGISHVPRSEERRVGKECPV